MPRGETGLIDDSDLLAGLDRDFLGFVSPTAPRIQAGGHPCQGIYTRPKGRMPALVGKFRNSLISPGGT